MSRSFILRVCLALCALAGFWVGRAAAGPGVPEAGVQIRSRATATFRNPVTATTLTVQSNEVVVQVLPQEALALTQDRSVSQPPGSIVALPHRLRNTGNVPSVFTLTFQGLPGGYALGDLNLVRDLNGNGVVDAGEPALTSGSQLTLGVGAYADLLLRGTVPAEVVPGAEGRMELRAVTSGQGLSAVNTDSILAATGPVLTVTKFCRAVSARPGDEVEYTFTINNVGAEDATGIPLTIDGAAATRVLLRDTVPANSAFVAASVAGGGQLLFHSASQPPNAWLTSAPVDCNGAAYAVTSFRPGQAASLTLRVRVSDNARGALNNVAVVQWSSAGGGSLERPSNPVTLPLEGAAPVIEYFRDQTFAQEAPSTSVGSPLYVQVDTAECNVDPLVAERFEVSLTSTKTGDAEVFTAIESGPNTGIFQVLPAVPTADGAAGANPGNGILETVPQDDVIARESCTGFEVTANILVDPFGIVFDSRTNAPVPGATVTLIDVDGFGNGGSPGGLAVVFEADGVTRAPSVVVTGPTGFYQFPLVAASRYRLQVAPPVNFQFPSQVLPSRLPPGRVIDPSFSYGGIFQITAGQAPIELDLPVDGPPPSGLFLTKTSNRQVVEIGDVVEYTVEASNGTGDPLTGAMITDELPFGFSYVPGSSRINGNVAAEPSGAPGPRLEYRLDLFPNGSRVVLTYRLRVGPGAGLGLKVNRAQTVGTAPTGTVFSNVGSAQVRVEPGIFTDRGVLIGRVFADLDGDGAPGPGEPGVPGVRLVLQDGTFVITDVNGKYSLYGLRARTHVARVDRSSLPAGASMVATSQRHGGDPYSRFVDLRAGELHRADFALGQPSEQVLAAIEARSKAAGSSEAERLLERRMRPEAAAPALSEGGMLPSTGLIGPAGPIPMEAAPPRGEGLVPGNSNRPAAPAAPAAPGPTEEEIAALSPELGFVGLLDGEILAAPQANVRVKGRLGTSLRLTLNGALVPEGRVGTRSSLPAKELQVWEYIGVDFKPGENTLQVDQVDAFGNVRETVTIQLKAPGQAGQVRLTVPPEAAPADGRTPVPVTVEVLDEQGLAVTSRTPITLEADGGQWEVEDLDPSSPGVQTFLSGGRTEFPLLPPVEAGTVTVRARSGILGARGEVEFVTEKRPLFAVGVLEAQVNLRSGATGPVTAGEFGTLLEDELDRLGRNDGAGLRADARGEVYVKGHVGGGYVVTGAYDSQRERDQRLFRDIQPDEYYPIYGDSAVKGFDAQTTGPVYLRVDKDKNHFLYGDFVTAAPDRGQGLGTYFRSLTGSRLHLQGDRHRVNLFGTRSTSRQQIQEIPANGTSGPYLLNVRYIRVNSERVELITRDRNQPTVILSTRALGRFTDYVVDFQSGGILFRRPVQSLDPNLNPVLVRVTYEVEGGGVSSWVFGGDARFKLTDMLSIGGTFAREDDRQDPYSLWSANLGLQLGEKTRLTAEVAATDRLSRGAGRGNYFELLHEGEALQARVYSGRTDASFDNPSAILTAGRTESGLKSSLKLDSRTQVQAEALRTRDNLNGGELTGYALTVDRQIVDGVSFQVGWRRAMQRNGPAQLSTLGVPTVDLSTLRARLNAQVPGAPQATVFAEYEQDVRDSSKQALALGGDYQMASGGRVYARHELISTLGGRFELNEVQRRNATVVGVDTDYMEGGRIFSEYRIRDAITGREAEAAIGLRNSFVLADGLRFNAGYERILGLNAAGALAPVGALPAGNQAITGALEYTADPNLKGTARLEFRNGGGSAFILRTLGLAWKVSPDLSVLVRDVGDSATAAGTGAQRRLDRSQLGLAWRPADGGPFNALVKVERRFEQDDGASRLRRSVALVSLTGNYQAAPGVNLSGWYAGKFARETSSGLTTDTTGHLLGGRLLWQLGQRWDLGLQGMKFFSPDTGADRHTFGLEGGYMIFDDTWLSAGYNFTGFEDRDLSVENFTAQGPFLRLRLKFGVDQFEGGTP